MKHMKLVALLAAALMVHPVFADKKEDKAPSKIEKIKRYGCVGLHVGEVALGLGLIAIWAKHGGTLAKLSLEKKDALFAGSLPLIWYGVRGLHHDMHRHIFYHLNAWRDRYEKKKEQEGAK